MQTQKFQVPRQRWVRPLIAALAAAASGGARADEPNPWYIGASQALTHDSNVYRTPNGPGDTYSSTALLGGFDQPIGRQRLYGSANVTYNKYRDQSVLDNTSYGLNAGWDWATIEKLSGSVNVNANQNLATFYGNTSILNGNTTSSSLTTRNLVKTDQVATSVRWGADGPLSLEGSYAHSRVNYSAPESLSSQSYADTASIGLYHRLGADHRVGAPRRDSRTVSPYAIAITPTPTGPADYQSNTMNGRNLDLTAAWRSTAQTSVNARLSWTQQTNSYPGEPGFSGLTGSVSATYAPTAKLAFSASLSRDAGINSSFFNLTGTTTGTSPTAPVTGLSAYSQTTNTYSLGASYAATAKINVNAAAQYRHANLVNSFAAGGVATSNEQTDNLRDTSLGVTYAIARNWQLACTLSHESRSVSPAFAYSDNMAGCSAQVTLR